MVDTPEPLTQRQRGREAGTCRSIRLPGAARARPAEPPETAGLTPGEARVVALIARLTAAGGSTPSVREMTKAFGHASNGWVQRQVARLRARGVVTAETNKARTLRLAPRGQGGAQP